LKKTKAATAKTAAKIAAKKLNLFIFCLTPHLIFAGIEFQQFIALKNKQ
jgi:hypothetical protein